MTMLIAFLAGDELESAGYYVAVAVAICLAIVIGLNWYLYRCKKRQEG